MFSIPIKIKWLFILLLSIGPLSKRVSPVSSTQISLMLPYPVRRHGLEFLALTHNEILETTEMLACWQVFGQTLILKLSLIRVRFLSLRGRR